MVLQEIIESRQHTGCELKRLLKIPAKICRYFRCLDFFFALFLHICFWNFEVKIARFIKVYVQRKGLMKCSLGLTTHLKGFFSDKWEELDSFKVKYKKQNIYKLMGPLLMGTSFRAAMNLIIKSNGVKSKVMQI